MASLSTLQYEVLENINVQIDDTNVTRRFITRLINEKRAKFLYNHLSGNRQLSSQITQPIRCLEMELTDKVDCCLDAYKSGCLILRSVKQIPKIISYRNNLALTKIGSPDITEASFNIVELDAIPTSGYGRFNKNVLYTFIFDQYVYVISRDQNAANLIERVNVHAAWEDPTALKDFLACDKLPCWTVDAEYPLEDWMWNDMKPYIIQELIQKQSIPTDGLNDNQDTANTQPLPGQ